MGSIFRLPVAPVTAEEARRRRRRGRPPDRGRRARRRAARRRRAPGNAIVAIGNERHGVGGFLPRWDRAVRIEQASATESLNAAVAGSIVLYVVSSRR